ncbi:hypothetical protein ACFVTM_09425 [Arthrobacter sp. NPDC058130]|uniref:hypothetical protein n=1 Tax=Arthrobacter sp. NPDC058130 TaxID=3346353 RepID=UPI0036EC859C
MNCRTDRHVIAASITVLDAGEGILTLSVTCTACGDSQVLVTTAPSAAAILRRAGFDGGVTNRILGVVHCREPMSLLVPQAENAASRQPGPLDHITGYFPAYVLRCRCGFQMDAPAST